MGKFREKLRKAFHKPANVAQPDNENASLGARAAALKAGTADLNPYSVTRQVSDQLGSINQAASSNDTYRNRGEQRETLQRASNRAPEAHQSFQRVHDGATGAANPRRNTQEDGNFLEATLPAADENEISDALASMNFEDTEDTTVHEQTAAPVVHETVVHDVHEIREERIEREIHEYHEITHIQPVIETEVLPARHFLATEDGLQDITDQMPAE